MKRILKLLFFRWKNRAKHVKLFWTVNILRNTQFEGYNKVCAHSQFGGYFGLCSYIGGHCKLRARVGRFSSIAFGCESVTGVHPYKAPYVSTSPLFVSQQGQVGLVVADKQYVEEKIQADKTNNYDVIIGNDCWIGYKANIVSGVNIGDGAVVLSRAFVTKDIPPYAIVGGVPAKVIGYRYDKEQIDALLRIKWWNMPLEQIVQSKYLFLDIDKFIKQYDV